MPFQLPKLPYTYDALEPWIDARTMEIHHGKHHQGYVDNLNKALGAHPDFQEKPLEDLLRDLNAVPEDIRAAVRNHGGGHYNHATFWQMMAPAGNGGGGLPTGALADAMAQAFGSLDMFKEEFAKAAMGRFGSGWAWLVRNEGGILSVTSTPNQDTPISEVLAPLLGLDVWEHAYYLKYQNRRAEYVAAFWNIVHWPEVERRYHDAMEQM